MGLPKKCKFYQQVHHWNYSVIKDPVIDWLQDFEIIWVSLQAAFMSNAKRVLGYPAMLAKLFTLHSWEYMLWKTKQKMKNRKRSSWFLDYSHLQCPGDSEWLILFFIQSFVDRWKIGVSNLSYCFILLALSLYAYWIPLLDVRDIIYPKHFHLLCRQFISGIC